MAITYAKLTLHNEHGKELVIEAIPDNPGQETTPTDFGKLILQLTETAGEATSQTPGFIEWGQEQE